MSAPSSLRYSRSLRFIITGAARGLGRGLARSLLVLGHDVYLLDKDDAELRHTLERHLPSASKAAGFGRFNGTVCDISDPRSVQAALRSARSFHRDGHCDVLVNNAGRSNPYWSSIESLGDASAGSQGETSDLLSDSHDAASDPAIAEWNEFLDTNLTGALLMTRLGMGMLKRPRTSSDEKGDDFTPSIIMISSTRSMQSEPNQEGYASTKAGLLGLTHALASSLAPVGVRANAILPGWFPVECESQEGDLAGKKWDDGLTETDQSQHWSGRVGRVEDLVNAVLYLASTRFANGEQLRLDGGMTRKMQYVE